MVDEALIAEVKIAGLRPTQQKRTRELLVRLVKEGLALLAVHDFDSLSIETLCERCDTTIGSFYARFESKETFVDALQRIVVEDVRRSLVATYASDRVPQDTLRHFLMWTCKGGILWIREYEGLVRASLRRASIDRRSWTPMRELGRFRVEQALPHVLRLATGKPGPDLESRVRLAFQMLYGTLNTMVLINPGPLSLHDPATPRVLAEAMVRLIEG
jgi:AcrR family transcriptional regulator